MKAVDDAVTQTNTVLVLLCGSSISILTAILDPDFLRGPMTSIDWIVIVVCVPLLFIVSRRLRAFSQTLEFGRLALPFQSSKDRKLTLAAFLAVPFVCIALLVLAFHVISP
jgi:hypothetical protein